MRHIANLRINIQGVGERRLKVGGGIINGSSNFDMTYEQEPQTLSVWLESVLGEDRHLESMLSLLKLP